MLKTQTDQMLVALLSKGSKAGFEEIFKRYWKKLYAFAYAQLGSKEEAEEMVQELFENIWVKRASLKILDLGPYLFVAIKHKITNYIKSQINFRKYQEYLIFSELSQSAETENIVNFNDLSHAIDLALKALPEKTSEIFRKNRLENYSIENIAEEMGLTPKAVEYHLTKSLKHLRASLSLRNFEN